MQYWIKVAGTGDNPFDRGDWATRSNDWVREYGPAAMFPKRARVSPGDRFILYAAGSHAYFGEGRIYAVSEVQTELQPSPLERWPWQVEAPILISGPRLEHCPMITDIDVERRSLRRQSHIRLNEAQGRQAEELITNAAARFGALDAL
jgi:hypothetical protein